MAMVRSSVDAVLLSAVLLILAAAPVLASPNSLAAQTDGLRATKGACDEDFWYACTEAVSICNRIWKHVDKIDAETNTVAEPSDVWTDEVKDACTSSLVKITDEPWKVQWKDLRRPRSAKQQQGTVVPDIDTVPWFGDRLVLHPETMLLQRTEYLEREGDTLREELDGLKGKITNLEAELLAKENDPCPTELAAERKAHDKRKKMFDYLTHKYVTDKMQWEDTA